MGPALGTAESLDASLRGALQIVAVASGSSAALLVGLALVGESLRRRRRGTVIVTLLDRCLPRPVVGVAAAILTAVSLGAAALPAHAAQTPTARVRAWLHASSTSPSESPTSNVPPSTAPATIATPRSIEQRHPTAGAPPGAVVHIPAATVTRPATPHPPTPLSNPPIAVHAPAAAVGTTSRHVVRPGECLWSIAADLLGPRATNRATDAGWRRIYAANRVAIGPDPNLIRPGLALALPPIDDLR